MTRREDITPQMLLRAYAVGVFPMAESRRDPDIGWYDPERRGILPIAGMTVPARLRRTVRQQPYRVTFNSDFPAVIRACADARPDTWINDRIIDLYTDTHHLGAAHSVEAWATDGTLVGGLYGLSIGGAFFGESMFSTARDASKIALVHLAARLRRRGFVLLDAQFVNEHLLQFGCQEISRSDYHARLAAAITLPASFTDDYSVAAGAGSAVAAGDVAAGVSAGADSLEKLSDFADVADFLQSITQTS